MTVKITPKLLADLRRKGEATPNPKWMCATESHGCRIYDNANYPVAQIRCEEDAQFIATADPATVLALVAEIERIQNDLEVTKTALNLLMWDYYTTDVDEEKIEEFCKKQIELAKKYRESEAGR
jgi:hypothetical protein